MKIEIDFSPLDEDDIAGEPVEDGCTSEPGDKEDVNLEKKSKVKLECLRTFPLYSEICSLKSIRLSNAVRDSLLVSFSDAKIAVVEYDPSTHDLNTLSLHYFEDEDMKEGRNQYSRIPEIRVDPDRRCAALLTYGRNIIILPFRKEFGVLDESDVPSSTVNNVNSPKDSKSNVLLDSGVPKSAVMPSYKLNLNDKQYAQEKIHNIIDFQFLNGYYEPTLLILHEPVRTWAGRVAVRRDTCSMVTLSLNVHQKVHPIIWSASHLPYDCFAALPIPKPIGGVIILAANSLIYLNQSVPPYAVSLNSFADSTSSFTKTIQRGVKISLDCSKACFISNDKIVISLKTGEIYVVTLCSDGMKSMRKFHFDKSASSVIPSCITCCEEGYLFLGSRLGNSLLLKYTEKLVQYSDKDFTRIASATIDDGTLFDSSPIPEVLGEDIEPTSLPTEDAEEKIETEDLNDRSQFNELSELNEMQQMEVENDPPVPSTSESVNGDDATVEITMNGDANGEINGAPNDEDEDMEPSISASDNDNLDSQKPGDIGDWAAGDVALMKDSDELEVYGIEESSEDKLRTSFTFELCDSLINIGPCGRICMGEPAFLSEDFLDPVDPPIEMVTTSGYGKNGALCVLHRTIRPQIITTYGLPKCLDMWTVYGPPESDDFYGTKTGDNTNSDFHAYLILTRSDSTMILQTEQEINELDHGGLSSHFPTIFAGNLFNNRYIVQVSPFSVRLSEGTTKLHHTPLDLGSPVIHVSLVDPYAILLTRSGKVIHLGIKYNSSPSSPSPSSSTASDQIRLVVSELNLSCSSRSKIATLCVYKDTSGKFTTEGVKSDRLDQNSESYKLGSVNSGLSLSEAAQLSMAATVDDEDELLYGNSTVEMVASLTENTLKSVNTNSNEQNGDKMIAPANIPVLETSPPTYWLFTVLECGSLEILRLPGLEPVFCCKNFSSGPKVLVDCESDSYTATSGVKSAPFTPSPIVREILVQGLGLKGSRPILFARNDTEIMIYELFLCFEDLTKDRLRVRFRRMENTLLVREPRVVRGSSSFSRSGSNPSSSNTKDSQGDSNVNILDKATMHQRWFRPFSDISSYGGVFICGPYPHWCFMTTRGELRIHEMNIDGPVTCFAPFHNVNCPKGFLYFNSKDELRIAVLPTQVTYDACWPVRKVPLRCNINFVNYHVDSKCYCVVTSVPEVYKKLVRVGGEEKDYDILERDARYLWPTTERFSIQLFSPVSWEFIPGTKISLDEWEHVTCVKNVMLNSEGTESGLKGYIALGTNYCYGEDVTNRGRIWILDIIEVVPELGLPLTRSKIKTVYCKEQKGPVTAICQIKGLLLSAVGQKIYIWQLKEAQLVGVAFIDTQIYIHQAVSVKNLILVADVYKSISLLRYQDDTRTLALASRDHNAIEVYACEFLVDNNHLCFLVADGNKNLLIYSYQPEAKESYGGTKLLRRADYHLGSHVNSFFRIRCKYPRGPIQDPEQKKSIQKRHLTVFPTIDGTINYILPISEKTYRRLNMLQNIMNSNLQHPAGVNPKGVHMVKFHKKTLTNPMRNVLDGDLLFRFLNLSIAERAELCKKTNSTPEQITDDLQEIHKFTDHF